MVPWRGVMSNAAAPMPAMATNTAAAATRPVRLFFFFAVNRSVDSLSVTVVGARLGITGRGEDAGVQ
jgi:hypothetical protein